MNDTNERYHRNCDPHDAANCDINDHDNLDPALDDCGHTVDGPGPGKNLPKADGHGGVIHSNIPHHNADQEPEKGPGV